jgi:hypothetical protein
VDRTGSGSYPIMGHDITSRDIVRELRTYSVSSGNLRGKVPYVE